MFAAAALAASLALAGVHAAPVANLATVEAALSPSNTTHHNASIVTYEMNGNAGACGWYSKDSDLVAGLPLEEYTDLSSASPFCGQYIVVTDPRDNTTATLLVADASTQNNTLSLSQGSFAALNGTASDLKVVDWRFANETETDAAKAALSSGSSSSKAPSSTSSYVAPSSTSAYVAPSSSSSAVAKEYKQESTTSYAPKTTTTTKAYTPPTTSYAPKTTTTTTYSPKPTTTEAAATKAAANYKSSSSSGSYSGEATYFYQNGVAGACGSVHSDSDYIIALQTSMYAGGSNCGRTVSISYGGKTISAKVADECPTCVSSTSIDLSSGAFQALAGLDAGMVSIGWSFQ